jgi:hypothetical protein
MEAREVMVGECVEMFKFNLNLDLNETPTCHVIGLQILVTGIQVSRRRT